MSEKTQEEMLEGTVVIELDDPKKPTKAKVKPPVIKATKGKQLKIIYKGTGKVTVMFPVDWFEGGKQVHRFGDSSSELDLTVRTDAQDNDKGRKVPYQVYVEVINDYGQSASPPKMVLDP